MKKYFIFILLVVNLSACNNDSELENLASSFAKSLSKGDTETLYKQISNNAENDIEELITRCNKASNKIIVRETFSIFKKHKGSLREYIQEGAKLKTGKLTKILEDKYPDMNNLSEEKQKSIQKEMFSLIQDEIINPSVEKLFKENHIKTDKPDLIKEIIKKVQASLLSNEELRTKKGTRSEITRIVNDDLNLPKVLKPQCVKRNTAFGYINSINLIEIMKSSSDVASVRLELISDDGNSKKVDIGIEEIKKKWKVISFSPGITDF